MYNELTADYCFVFGCPRSGTTMAGQLLHSHEAVAMGIERYKYLLRHLERHDQLDQFTPALFEPARFFDFRETDTNVAPPGFGKHYQIAEKRLAKGLLRVVGDKVMPPTTPIMQAINDQFPEPRFVFIYRDLLRVASSYAVRAADPDDAWPTDNGPEMALEQWLEAFDVADALIDQAPGRVFILSYDGLFTSDGAAFDALLAFLGLAHTPKSEHRYANTLTRWKRVNEKPLALSERAQRDLLDRVDPHLVARFDELFAQSTAGHMHGPQTASVR